MHSARCMKLQGGGNGAIDGGAAALFSAGIAARTSGKVLWCLTGPDEFAPRLRKRVKSPTVSSTSRLAMKSRCWPDMRKGSSMVGSAPSLRGGAPAHDRLAATSARRRSIGQPTAAMTRWRISVLPSTPLPDPGVGRLRWLVELVRCPAGESADSELETCDNTGSSPSSCRP